MSKVNKKFIKFGTGSNDVNAQAIPATYTPTNYTPSNVASEGTDKISAHLKGIDTALATAGGGSYASFSLANNQTSPANITDLTFDSSVSGFQLFLTVSIDATTDLNEAFQLVGINTGSSWELSTQSFGTDDSQVVFSITSLGQVQYTSGNYTGFSSGTLKYRSISGSGPSGAVTSVNGQTGDVVITKSDVGLSNVDNTSDATKNSAVATLTNKTLTSPVINNPTGLVKADVGLSNVDNTSDLNKPISTATQTALNEKVNNITSIINALIFG